MKLSQVKLVLKDIETTGFLLPNKNIVPNHFHVTEVGKVTKHFIDCGGTERNEEVISFQLWSANDYDHRLHPKKLLDIIELSEKVLGIEDLEIEVEYQADTIGKFGLEFEAQYFLLTNKQTDCLAKDKYGIPVKKNKKELSKIQAINSCFPGSGCC